MKRNVYVCLQAVLEMKWDSYHWIHFAFALFKQKVAPTFFLAQVTQ